jgi:hypothetical protein
VRQGDCGPFVRASLTAEVPMSSPVSFEPDPSPQWGRVAAISLGWFKGAVLSVTALMFFLESISRSQDPAGRGMAGGFFLAALLYLLVFVVPALVLAHRNRLIWLSLAMLLVPDALLLPAISLL